MRDVKDCESIAGHMYRMSLMTFLLDNHQQQLNGDTTAAVAGSNQSILLDRIKCMEIALVHDLAEAIVGDLTPYCGVSREDKRTRELNAMEDIAKLAGSSGTKLLALYHEYEQGKTPEAKFVKDLDKLDMIMQAFEYEKQERNLRLQEFFDNTEGKFTHPFVQRLVEEVYEQRKQFASKLASDDNASTQKS